MKLLPVECPACNSILKVKSLICQHCETEIQGEYELPVLTKLSPEEQAFILDFINVIDYFLLPHITHILNT